VAAQGRNWTAGAGPALGNPNYTIQQATVRCTGRMKKLTTSFRIGPAPMGGGPGLRASAPTCGAPGCAHCSAGDRMQCGDEGRQVPCCEDCGAGTGRRANWLLGFCVSRLLVTCPLHSGVLGAEF
jgi:uncharacterized Zn-binding protein involved in type VI secretion